MVGVGFTMLFASRNERVKQYGTMLMGLGLVFFGMSVMSDAMKPLRSYQPFLDLMIPDGKSVGRHFDRGRLCPG